MFREMRRPGQALDRDDCIRILGNAKRGTLSVLGDDGYPYGVTMSPFFDKESNRLFFHCGKAGHKLDAMRNCDKVSFCTISDGVKTEKDWALRFESVVVFGKVRFIEDLEMKTKILSGITANFPADPEFLPAALKGHLDKTICFELVVEHMTGKRIREA